MNRTQTANKAASRVRMARGRFPKATPGTKDVMASLEPWQVEAMTLLRESLGVNDGAILRAGVTLVLMMVGAAPGIIAQAMSDGSVSAQVIDVECGAVAKAGEED